MMYLSPKVPSLELQTVEFIMHSRALSAAGSIDLQRHGFRATVEYEPALSLEQHGVLTDIVAIIDVHVPSYYRRRGWLTYYLNMCELLAGDALFVASLHTPVREALLRRGFVPVFADFLMLKKEVSHLMQNH